MIRDPIKHLNPNPSYHSTRDFSLTSGKRFVITEIKNSNAALYYFDSVGDYHFVITKNMVSNTCSFYTRPRASSVTKEIFLDFVKSKYPDHFEWLLFRPEWL